MKATRRLVTVAMLKKHHACDGGIEDFQAINGCDRMWVTVAGARALYDSLPFSFLGNLLTYSQRRRCNARIFKIYETHSEELADFTARTDAEIAKINPGDTAEYVRQGRVYKQDWINMIQNREQKIAMTYARAFIAATPSKKTK